MNTLDEFIDRGPIVMWDKYPEYVYAVCVDCQKHVKLPEPDETGYRIVLLMGWRDYVGERHESPVKQERWVCEECWDKLDEEAYDD